MASRQERFQRRIRGAGVRQLADDDFGFALSGAEPSLTPGTAAQRVKKVTPKSRPTSSRKSMNRRQVDALSAAVVEEVTTRVDQDGNTSKKLRISLGEREPETEPTDLEPGPKQISPSSLNSSADGKRRKKRKSVGQKSLRKRLESRDPDVTIPEVEETEAPGQEISISRSEEIEASGQENSTSRADKIENREKEATVVLEQPTDNDGLPSLALAVEGIGQELRIQTSSGGYERMIDNGSVIARSRTKGSQSLSPPGDKAETQDQQLSIPERPSQLPMGTSGTSRDIVHEREDAILAVGSSGDKASEDTAIQAQDEPHMEQVNAGRSDTETAAPEITVSKFNGQQLEDKSETTCETSSGSDTSVIMDQSKTAVAKQPASIGKHQKAFVPDVVAIIKSSQDNAPKRRGRPRKKMLAIAKQPGRTLTIEADRRPTRSIKGKISISRACGKSADTAVKLAELSANSLKSYGNNKTLNIPRKKQHPKHHNEAKPSGLSANTVQFPTYSITGADFLPPSLYNEETLSSRMPALFPNEYISKPNPTVADVLAQASFEIIESTVTKIRKEVTNGGIEAATSQRIRSMVQTFGQEISDRLRDMSRLMSQNGILARRVKHSRQTRKDIINEVMELRKERKKLEDKHFQWSGRLKLAKEIRAGDERVNELLQGFTGAFKLGRSQGSAGEEMVGAEFFRRALPGSLSDG